MDAGPANRRTPPTQPGAVSVLKTFPSLILSHLRKKSSHMSPRGSRQPTLQRIQQNKDSLLLGVENENMQREMKNFGVDFYKMYRTYSLVTVVMHRPEGVVLSLSKDLNDSTRFFQGNLRDVLHKVSL